MTQFIIALTISIPNATALHLQVLNATSSLLFSEDSLVEKQSLKQVFLIRRGLFLDLPWLVV